MIGAGGRAGLIRLVVGLGISVVFAWATLRQVDLVKVGAALQRVNVAALGVVIGFVAVELVLRSYRWRVLLRPIADVPLRLTTAYLAIGYFANTMLPARLGDVARAFLAGRAFNLSRLAVLGTIVVERLADGLFILGIVVLLGFVVAGGADLETTAIVLSGLAVVGLVVLGLVLAWIRRPGEGLRGRLRSLVDRVLVGASALRSPGSFALAAFLTAAAFGLSIASFWTVATAAGVSLSLGQAALVMGGLALSTSIPAAPGSLGTYEFVGTSILTALGVDPAVALAIVVVIHVMATLPLALAGLVSAWQLHFRVSEIAADGSPAHLAEPAP
ncbi:MAG TPA: lysylphosphatidylglycerol synthase transmembrane domain-containing protein [Candidatus Limnocylindrales bacterium]|nr:lysylphosphatidylglycerol synthase transmembrane domain-containing protein [Candidatus Limnocylindrales bacterium]